MTRSAFSAIPATAPRAIVYVRQSAYREESISLESQEYIAREYAERMGYEVVDVEADGATGRTWKRPGVQAAMAAIEDGRADIIVLWKWSRLSRSRKDWAVAADRADIAGGRIESATEAADTATAAGRFQRGVMVEMAAFESERIGEVWRETHEHRRRHGLPPTGGHRFGYRIDNGAYVPDDHTGPVLADMYRRYLGGMGSAQITRHLNENGELRGEKPWTYQGVMNVLDSGFGAGLLGRTKPKRLPVWERDYAPGNQPPVIDEQTWAAYVARRADRYRQPTHTATTYLLTGLVRCGDCGGPMHGKRLDGRPSYVCSRASVTNGKRKVTMVAWRVDKTVEEWVTELAGSVAQLADADAKTRTRTRAVKTAAKTIRADIEKAERRLVRFGKLVADETMTPDAYRLNVADTEAELKALRMRLTMAAANPVTEIAPMRIPADIAKLWPRMTNDHRSLLLRPLIRQVVVSPAPHRGAVTANRVTILRAWDKEPDA